MRHLTLAFFFIVPITAGWLACLLILADWPKWYWRAFFAIAFLPLSSWAWLEWIPAPTPKFTLGVFGGLSVIWGLVTAFAMSNEAERVGWPRALLIAGLAFLSTGLFIICWQFGVYAISTLLEDRFPGIWAFVIIFYNLFGFILGGGALVAFFSAITDCPKAISVGASLMLMYVVFLVPDPQTWGFVVVLWPIAWCIFPVAYFGSRYIQSHHRLDERHRN